VCGLQSCGRYDLLNKLYQASGEWDKAIAVAEEHDRIHLKTTHYLVSGLPCERGGGEVCPELHSSRFAWQYAKHLEATGDFSGAVKEYELSNTHRTEVPRMLFDLRKLADLAAYIDAKDDKALLQWWAQFCESNGDFVSAVRYYNVAEDALSLVRLYCFNNDFNTVRAVIGDWVFVCC
jgi:intraflagellar transport protein 140